MMGVDFAPGVEAVARSFAAGRGCVAHARLIADCETPVSAYLKLAGGQRMAFLLESVEGGAVIGRYSFIGIKPDLVWKCRDGKAALNRQARYRPDAFAAEPDAPFASLRRLLAESELDLPPDLPPMAAGLFGHLGYDMVRLVERLPDPPPDALGVPDALLLRPTLVAVFDAIARHVTLVTPVRPAPGLTPEAAWAAAQERLADAIADLGRPLPATVRPGGTAPEGIPPTSNTPRIAYDAMLDKAKEYIKAGDIFQVVLSQRFSLPFAHSPFAFYRALRRLNPSPFLFHLEYGDFAVVGSSPEILVRLRDDTVTIRPIAGTRKRGATPAEDAALAADLLADPKELAEHLMLLDLGRNDVGRVAKTGTVRVTDRNMIELYSHVMHIVSNVEGEIDPKHDALDALMAGFPAGTVSGAPKVRAMEIIDELESHRRGVYGGCVGYFGAGGGMDSCIALRTAVIKDGVLHAQAGGGIVYDSDTEAEYQETVNKAKALIRAAAEAARLEG